MHVIRNNDLKVLVSTRGAELQSLWNLKTGQELLWQGNPAVWNRRSPVLFPVVGAAQDGMVDFGGQRYPMRKHGFARDLDFELVNETPSSLQFALRDNFETRQEYPFGFSLELRYHLEGPTLKVGMFLSSGEDLVFNWGGHPGFACPAAPGPDSYAGWSVVFEAQENQAPRLLDAGGLVSPADTGPLPRNRVLDLEPGSFDRDALIWENPASTWVELRQPDGQVRVRLDFKGFSALGIWGKPGGGFVCLEPWLRPPQTRNQAVQLVSLAAGEVHFSEFSIGCGG